MDYVKDETKKGVMNSKLPFCAKCEGRGSSMTAKFCSGCGSKLFLKAWDDDLDAVTYQCVATGETQLSTPRWMRPTTSKLTFPRGACVAPWREEKPRTRKNRAILY